jgi:hypothetical protein
MKINDTGVPGKPNRGPDHNSAICTDRPTVCALPKKIRFINILAQINTQKYIFIKYELNLINNNKSRYVENYKFQCCKF